MQALGDRHRTPLVALTLRTLLALGIAVDLQPRSPAHDDATEGAT